MMLPRAVRANKALRVIIASIIVAAVALFTPICFMSVPSGGVFAAPDSNGDGHPASELKIYVGYAGYPYEERKTYTPSSLMEIGGEVKQLYTWIDRMPAPCLNPARGVKLSDILEDAGIDYASAERVHFTCNDEHETEELTAPYLFDVTKYYYPNLFEYWDYEASAAGVGAAAGRERVETIIAVEDVWQRVLGADDEMVGFGDMDGERRFRLVFGMTDTEKQTAYNSAMWIESIEVMLAGAPPEDAKDDDGGEDQDGKVGSEKGDKPPGSESGDDGSKDSTDKDNSGAEKDNDGKDSGKTDKDKDSKNSKDSKDKSKADKDKDKDSKEKDATSAGGGADSSGADAGSAGSADAAGNESLGAETSAGALGGVTVAALAGGSGERTMLGKGTLRELTIDGAVGAGGGLNQGAYQPWRTHDISDDATWLKVAGLRGDLEGPVGIGLGGLAGMGAGLYLLGIKRGIF
ncbi:MAG: hypothetical protein LBL54_04510 [Clostridiales Family XIII bacterium]|jgi:hypothetical protein|nr:hypothetical protein [Clostridiales Family XIII bacterium]